MIPKVLIEATLTLLNEAVEATREFRKASTNAKDAYFKMYEAETERALYYRSKRGSHER